MIVTTLAATALSLSPPPQDAPVAAEPIEAAATDAAFFAEPVPLMSVDSMVGRGLLYPSPRVFDVDFDGAVEIVMGDLPGSLWVVERASETDLTQWTERKRLEATDGEAIDFNNW